MAKASLSRLFSSLSKHSISKPSFTGFRSDSVTRFASNSATHFVCSSAQQSQLNHGGKVDEEDGKAVRGNLESKNKEESEGVDEEDHVNKETGEVGGPKGPEPTRYGDWERNGRCYDF
ncbi:Detected protein of unknown function [Hibiscus syriacus]|uniref:Succinate dehydrogenase assembly factor 4, mitochondrial n=1 Tax=Hibiscus syriacus TaxID=106335 RepID=A0A6A3CKZ1_HIBSY|nr:succinate dehydrogenase assembly factor 4, mitochondrial-like [Hibiscus syriacus]XP_039057674.1 succinate dehydrogenase assembly factor 4, mitochondrial-like [Hibiscus syriacus]KAE8726453.1 Detected protein of unknown function [Hibiscus syriacus]KAE8728242.1 Detected protein of unknown function [Hibiscus syriacus]